MAKQVTSDLLLPFAPDSWPCASCRHERVVQQDGCGRRGPTTSDDENDSQVIPRVCIGRDGVRWVPVFPARWTCAAVFRNPHLLMAAVLLGLFPVLSADLVCAYPCCHA